MPDWLSIYWAYLGLISTEGALRRPLTYDNHPVPSRPIHPQSLFGIFWGYLRDILGIFLAYFGHNLGISWGYIGHILGISSTFLRHKAYYIWHKLAISWAFLRNNFCTSFGYLGHLLEFLKRPIGERSRNTINFTSIIQKYKLKTN